MLFKAILLLVLPFLVQCKDTHFDILIMTQHWPYTTCRDWEERSHKNACTKIEAKWSVHGLWPTQFGKIAPGFCNNTWKFEYSSIEKIRPELDLYWPDIEIRNEPNSLWTHEWEKHGTCAAQLKPLDSELKYFGAGVDLAKKLPLTDWLKEKNIIPGAEYDTMSIYAAIQEKTVKRPHVDCEHLDGEQYIKEIKVCFAKDLSITDCDGIVSSGSALGASKSSTGTCKHTQKVVYSSTLPKVVYPGSLADHTHLALGLVLGLGGSLTMLILMIAIYYKYGRASRRGYASI